MVEPRQSRRDGGITALVLGFFAAAWFGWGQAAPPAWLPSWLGVGSGLAWIVAVLGAVVGFRSPASTAAISDNPSRRRYGIIVGIEFGLAGIGAAALGMTGQAAYIAVWVCAVVGVHFFPLSPVLRDRKLIPLGALMTATAIVALIVGLTTSVVPTTITGVGAGLSLLVFAVIALVGALGQPNPV